MPQLQNHALQPLLLLTAESEKIPISFWPGHPIDSRTTGTILGGFARRHGFRNRTFGASITEQKARERLGFQVSARLP